MRFEYDAINLETQALSVKYHLVPWDSEIFARPVAQIDSLEIRDQRTARDDFQQFASWLVEQRVALCSCRLPASRSIECAFVQTQQFRFIELNYRPELPGIPTREFSKSDLEIGPAKASDIETLAEIAGTIFSFGRLHQDPRIGPEAGNRRYRRWMENAFSAPQQTVLKCTQKDQLVAFFVVEYPRPRESFWSLVGLVPSFIGTGIAKRVWHSVLEHHRLAGIEKVSTSISSLNVPVFNLYVSLGFRFPEPSITFHWMDPHSARSWC